MCLVEQMIIFHILLFVHCLFAQLNEFSVERKRLQCINYQFFSLLLLVRRSFSHELCIVGSNFIVLKQHKMKRKNTTHIN